MKSNIENQHFVYQYFSHPKRADIYMYIQRLSRYLHDKKIENIAFVDRSARAVWIGVHTYWNLHFKKEKMPKMYFFNPDGFREIAKYPLIKKKEIFQRSFPVLANELKAPLAVFDTCSHEGETLKSIGDILKKIKFSNFIFLTANTPDLKSRITVPITFDHGVNHTSCYPFGTVDLIERGYKLVCYRKLHADCFVGNQIRKEIKQIVIDRSY